MFRSDGEDIFELEPALLAFFNESHPVAIEVHGHFAKEGDANFEHEATGLALRTAFGATREWSWGGSIEHEFSAGKEPDTTELRLLAQREDERGCWTGNLIFEIPEGEATSWGYALGYRVAPAASVGYGAELVGNLTNDVHLLIPEAMFLLGAGTVVKAGIGVGLTDASPDWSAHIGLVRKL